MQKSFVNQLEHALVGTGNLLDWGTNTVTLALSVSDRRHRAQVTFIRHKTFKRAWEEVARQLAETPHDSWVRIESVQGVQRLSRTDFEKQLAAVVRMNYWRRGVSFDSEFKTAMLEMEINGNACFRPVKAHKIGRNGARAWVDYPRVEKYLKKRNGSVSPEIRTSAFVWTFTTAGIFTDGKVVYDLSTQNKYTTGMREITDFQTELAHSIDVGETFLRHQLREDGQFIYGYFPARQLVLKNYNMIRHFSSLYALMEAIEFTGRTEGYAQVKQALQWGIEHALLEKDGAAFINDKGEVKLGGQGMLMLALSKYQSLTGDATFAPVLEKVFKCVPAFIQPDGKLVHVLNPDLSVKNAFRIIYYEGEIVFGLTRLYELTKHPAVLKQIQSILDYMVAHNYGKYHDHWISYAVNEALHVFPNNRQYMAMGLKNAFGHLKFMEDRETAYPTLLELLDAAVKMIDLVRQSGNEDLLAQYDVIRLRRAWTYRAKYELLAGSFLPELAMYFYYPQKFIGGFHARHDNFRTRIDDCEHFLSGLINYYDYAYDRRQTSH